MGRLKKWGNRRLRIPDLGHFRLPKINGDTNRRFSARSSAFKSKPSRAAVRPQRTRFEANVAKAALDYPAGQRVR